MANVTHLWCGHCQTQPSVARLDELAALPDAWEFRQEGSA